MNTIQTACGRPNRPGRVICFLVISLMSGGSVAAPLLPNREPTGELLSLRELQELELQLDFAGPGAPLLKARRDATTKRMAKLLIDDGDLDIAGKAGPARLHLLVMTDTNADHPNLISYALHLSIEQYVVVERIDQRVFAPTYGLVKVGFTAKTRLAEEIDKLLPSMIRHFLSRRQAADELE